MALQRVVVTGTRNATTGFTSSNALPSTLQTATIVALASAITVGSSANVVDHEVTVTVNTGTFTAASSTVCNVFVYGSQDGSTWPGSSVTAELVTGLDKTLTQSTNGNNMIFLGSISCHTTNGVFTSKPMSIAAAFGGSMPAAYQIVVQNATTVLLAATGAVVVAQEVYYN